MLAEVNGIRMHYEQEGTGQDRVLVPGLGAGTHVWYAQRRALGAVMRVTAVDLRGQGRSTAAPGPYRMRLLADMVPQTALGASTHARQPALVGLFRMALLANDAAACAASCRAIVAADIRPIVGQLRCPTLSLLGSEEQVAPLPAAQALKAGIPHASLRVLPEAGHLPFLEQPAAFNAALLEFTGGLTR